MSSPGFSLDSLDPQTLQKLAALLSQQNQQPTANTPFSGAGNAGSKLLQAYLLKQGQANRMPQVMNQSMGGAGIGAGNSPGLWSKLSSMFGFAQ